GKSILFLAGEPDPEAIAPLRRRLLEARAGRVRPGRDDKVLAGWNGLACRAFAEAGRALGRADYVAAAVRNADFLLTQMRRDGRRAAVRRPRGRGRPGDRGRLPQLRVRPAGRRSGDAGAPARRAMSRAAVVLALLVALAWCRPAAAQLDELLKQLPQIPGGGQTGTPSGSLGDVKIGQALKQALQVGTENAVKLT